jgi:hypothetical protein
MSPVSITISFVVVDHLAATSLDRDDYQAKLVADPRLLQRAPLCECSVRDSELFDFELHTAVVCGESMTSSTAGRSSALAIREPPST